MNIEAHPAMHYAMVLAFYLTGLLIDVLSQAFANIASSSTIRSVKTYFALRWIPLTELRGASWCCRGSRLSLGRLLGPCARDHRSRGASNPAAGSSRAFSGAEC